MTNAVFATYVTVVANVAFFVIVFITGIVVNDTGDENDDEESNIGDNSNISGDDSVSHIGNNDDSALKTMS